MSSSGSLYPNARNDPRYNVVILETMNWLGLDFDELFYQSDRFDRYTAVAREFLDKGLAIAKDGALNQYHQFGDKTCRLMLWPQAN